eukprot:COSAG02_NODE_66165_length_256_cov_0.656051_1_plen_39_part_01
MVSPYFSVGSQLYPDRSLPPRARDRSSLPPLPESLHVQL